MPRIADEDRLQVVDNHLAHYEQAIILNGSAFEIEPGFGRPELVLLRDAFEALQLEIAALADEGGEIAALISERDDYFGTSEDDDGGVWFWIKEYKAAVKARLGGRHALTRTVPNLGKILPKNYLDIVHRFIVHWTRVNAALATPLVLGAFTLATLVTAHGNLQTKIEAIEEAEITLDLKREKREQDFGDEREDKREQTSLVAWMLKYQSVIRTKFPNQPIADSLPELFPGDTGTPLPTLPFNYVAQPGGVLKTFFAVAGLPAGAATVFLKEGAVELTKPIQTSPPDGMQVDLWDGITLVGDLDEFEFRDADGLTIARGVRNTSLPEPADPVP